MENDWLLGKYQRSILQVFFNNPNVSYSLRDLARRAQVDPGNTKRYVEKFVQKGLLETERNKNQILISPKYSHPITRKIFEAYEVRRTISFLNQDEKLREEILFLTELLAGLDSLLMISLCGFKRDATALLNKRLHLLIVKVSSESTLQIENAIDGLCKDYDIRFQIGSKIMNTNEFEDSIRNKPGFLPDFWSDRVVLHGESYLWRTIMRLRKPVEKAQSKAEAGS